MKKAKALVTIMICRHNFSRGLLTRLLNNPRSIKAITTPLSHRRILGRGAFGRKTTRSAGRKFPLSIFLSETGAMSTELFVRESESLLESKAFPFMVRMEWDPHTLLPFWMNHLEEIVL
jgi:hypothetical protein